MSFDLTGSFMKIHRICTYIGLCAMVLPHSLSAAEPAYPNRPVRLVLGFPPGGATDAMARIVAPKMADATGQSWIVDNRAGDRKSTRLNSSHT